MSYSDIQKLLENNKRWAEQQVESNPDYFNILTAQHKPKYLWIGCSDSRVPANVIMGLEPGEVFVHRNISNRVVHEDSNIQAVLQYAIESLKVEHIIVCGHYRCGGVKASLEGNTKGYLRNWVEPIRRNAIQEGLYQHDCEGASATDELWDKTCEQNVLQQAKKLRENPFYQDALSMGQKLTIHAWIYRIEDGLVKCLE